MSGIARSLDISASGLTAERMRMDVISNNLANINTTRGADGQPYRRQHVLFAANENGTSSFASMLRHAARGSVEGSIGAGVRVVGVEPDQGPLKKVWDPGHPDAVNGYVTMPNVEPVMEMVDLITATRAYDASISAIGAAKQMQQRAMDIGKG